MSQHEHATYREWIYLEADGGLAGRDRRALLRHLERCAECNVERRQARRVHRLLEEARVEPRPGFSRQVMTRLTPAGWEARHPRSWVAAAVLFLLLAGGAVAATLLDGPRPGPSLLTPLAAVADLLQSAALAGAGLLAASWSGLGGAVREALGGAPLPLAVFGLLILGLDVLFLRLLLRVRRRAAERRPER
ncbi:MAG: zf-HC2 domain-containing protein [Thermoanaerobaculia bacterium]|nr:zf-HC2 domain-containing protein [Thermoanaerobaculia bacterium]